MKYFLISSCIFSSRVIVLSIICASVSSGKTAFPILHLRHGKKTVMAVRIQILECCLFFPGAGRNSVRFPFRPSPPQTAAFAVPYMGKKHISRIPVPDLQGMQVQTVSICVYIQKSCVVSPDPRHRIKGMPSLYQREEGHRIQLKQIGTGHTEKIPHHQIRIPDRLQLGKAVKYIKGLFPSSLILS